MQVLFALDASARVHAGQQLDVFIEDGAGAGAGTGGH
jgi:hypothetical protein